MPIHLLQPEVASQIAAGEVVERPASVVKELVENALDAGANSISVSIQEAGRRLIEIADDGSGIPAAELGLAVERHATSKLVDAGDLFHIRTLGFRGEALASIGSVSRLTITSRVKDAAAGARIRVEGGLAGKLEPASTPMGTTVKVEGLFYNVPARLKFLKQDLTERRAIDGLLTRYALAYPNVRFRLLDGSTPSLQTTGDGDRRAIMAALYGVEVAKQMLEMLAEDEGLKLTGFISPAALTRSNRKEITFFINGRWVSDTPLSQALMQAYHTLLMVGRYPMAALFLEIDPQEVDVNVHPAKAEVRFRNQDRIFSFVQRTTRRALLAYSPVPALPPTQNLWGSRQPDSTENTPFSTSYPAITPGLEWSLAHDEIGNLSPSSIGTGLISPAGSGQQVASYNLPIMRLVGQIGATYLIAEGPDGLYLIDQHAAHERVLFEKLMAQHDQKNIPSQILLAPQLVQMTPSSAKVLEQQLPILQHFGFDVEAFGPGAFQVRAIPNMFAGTDPSAALRALVEDFEEDEAPLQSEIEAKIAGRVCKRLAVKAGKVLSGEEQRALLTDLENCDSPRTCPHGRPTMIHLSVDMLERQFGRKGAR
ncbi:MAG TPA: DNA mismatch repair endonuclease MutL [Anaerolineales bacterium]|jgi:DNA mismatch repair protein MutL